MKKIILILSTVFSLTACTNNQKSEQLPAQENSDNMEAENKYTPEMVVNKKDFVCGMPTTAGISDTAHYEGNTYGFCSSECKTAFQQDPKSYLVTK